MLLTLLSYALNVLRMDMHFFIHKFGRNAVKALAARAGTSVHYLYQFSGDGRTRQPSIPMAMKLIEQSEHVLTFRGLRPDVYELVKPEVLEELKQGESKEDSQDDTEIRTTGAGDAPEVAARNGGQIAPQGQNGRGTHSGVAPVAHQ
ncbi:MAG: hypothetical protein R3F02_18565 [Thiolinea sp.]